jgi:hypothetical protein
MIRINVDNETELNAIKELHKHTCVIGKCYCEIEDGNCSKCTSDNIELKLNGNIIELEV